jgi:predicted carbohydrate-binding protein with CBM5 and CBM33 domain
VTACAECGYDFDSLSRGEILHELTSLAAEHERLLSSLDAGQLRAHPRPSTWSALEYGCHVRDVLRFQRERVALAQAACTPRFVSMRRDERAVEERYNEQDPVAVAGELAAAARLLTLNLDALDAEGWQRTGVYPWPAPEVRTVAWIGRRTVHELAHHLFDCRRLLAQQPDEAG